jgi:hypothetical protein
VWRKFKVAENKEEMKNYKARIGSSGEITIQIVSILIK